MKLKILLLCCVLLLPSSLFAGDSALEDVLVDVTPKVEEVTARKMIILPFRTAKHRYTFVGGEKSFVEVSQIFRRKCVAAMADVDRFEVINDEMLQTLLTDNQLELTVDTPISVQLEVGKVLGVDYMLVGTILDAGDAQTPYTIQVSGEHGTRYNGSFVVDYRVMVVATGEVKWADSVMVNLDDVALQKMKIEVVPEQLYQVLFSQAATLITRNVMDDIYPLRVVQVQDGGEVIVNHGPPLVTAGEQYNVFLEGEDVVDPVTGETLGVADTWVATITITRVADKVSYAKLVNGSLENFSGKAICRRKEKKQHRPRLPGRISDVQPTIDGGVVLPFD